MCVAVISVYIFVLGGVLNFLDLCVHTFLLNLENFLSLCFLNICLHPFIRDANCKYVKTLEVVPLFAN